MRITEIDPFDDAALRAWHGTYLAAETFGRPYATPWMLEETRATTQAAPVAEEKVLSTTEGQPHRRDTVVTVATDPAGECVAYTQVNVSRQPGRAYQAGTLVDPAHRGHRLGLAVKVANHRQLQRRHPAVREVVTFNAESNVPMIEVNELLGFRPTARDALFQRTVS